MPERESGQYEISVRKPLVRRLREPERGILMWGWIREPRWMAKTEPLITLINRTGDFGEFWGALAFWPGERRTPVRRGLDRKTWQKFEPLRRIPAEMTPRLNLQDELSLIPGEPSQVEEVLGPGIP